MKKGNHKKGHSVYAAAKMFGIPEQTLQDHTLGKTKKTGSGGKPLFSHKEDEDIVNHVIQMAAVGWGYSRKDLQELLTETALYLKKRKSEEVITLLPL